MAIHARCLKVESLECRSEGLLAKQGYNKVLRKRFNMAIFFYKLRCPRCGHVEVLSRYDAQRRLQAAKKLRPGVETDEALLDELVPALLRQIKCEACHEACVEVTVQQERDEWSDEKKCAICGKIIPVMRLALLPDAELCAECQSAIDRGESPGPAEYCKRCGRPMKLAPRRIGGLTRYVWVCTNDPPCRS